MSIYWNDGTELYHYGILGQRWGVRRYQNPDGTLTEEGRRRYGFTGSERTKSLFKTTASQNNFSKSKSVQKDTAIKIAKYGAIAAGTLVAAYGAYKVVDLINEKQAIKIGTEAYNRISKDRRTLRNLVDDGKALREDSHNPVWKQYYRVGNQEYSWIDYSDHPELIPEHLRGSSNAVKERSEFRGQTPQEAYINAYNSKRFRNKRIS